MVIWRPGIPVLGYFRFIFVRRTVNWRKIHGIPLFGIFEWRQTRLEFCLQYRHPTVGKPRELVETHWSTRHVSSSWIVTSRFSKKQKNGKIGRGWWYQSIMTFFNNIIIRLFLGRLFSSRVSSSWENVRWYIADSPFAGARRPQQDRGAWWHQRFTNVSNEKHEHIRSRVNRIERVSWLNQDVPLLGLSLSSTIALSGFRSMPLLLFPHYRHRCRYYF